AQWPGRAFKMQCLAPIRAYFSYLSQLEAAVLGNDTAIAATYITFLAAAKHIKIFLPSTSYVYQWLRDIGRPVHTLEELEDTDRDAFLAPDGPFEMPEQLARRLDRDKTMEQWKELFAWMKESVEKNDE
ncbi:MAG: hypothetical protein IKD79_05075, partial [Oscillospiraceae bacterium]|nr:hypothetical protein [Oscillospiraceae bacterium]